MNLMDEFDAVDVFGEPPVLDAEFCPRCREALVTGPGGSCFCEIDVAVADTREGVLEALRAAEREAREVFLAADERLYYGSVFNRTLNREIYRSALAAVIDAEERLALAEARLTASD